MPQLLLIAESSLSTRDNREVHDIVGIFPDEHVFSEHERNIFTIVQIAEATKVAADVAPPEVREATRAKTTDWTLEEPEVARVWRDKDGSYKEVAVRPKYPTRYEKGEIVENYSRHPENMERVIIPAPKDGPVVRG
jgi:hypothetical protein